MTSSPEIQGNHMIACERCNTTFYVKNTHESWNLLNVSRIIFSIPSTMAALRDI